MNFKKVLKILGKIMILEGILMVAPLIVTFLYNESFINKLAFIIPILILVVGGYLLQLLKHKWPFLNACIFSDSSISEMLFSNTFPQTYLVFTP